METSIYLACIFKSPLAIVVSRGSQETATGHLWVQGNGHVINTLRWFSTTIFFLKMIGFDLLKNWWWWWWWWCLLLLSLLLLYYIIMIILTLLLLSLLFRWCSMSLMWKMLIFKCRTCRATGLALHWWLWVWFTRTCRFCCRGPGPKKMAPRAGQMSLEHIWAYGF